MLNDWSDRSARQPRTKRDLWLLIAALVILLCIALPAFAQSDAVPIIPRGKAFTCTPVAVWDGDGPIWCREGPHVRLARLAAREMDNSCRPRHPCPTASGVSARDHLVRLLGGKRGEGPHGHILVNGPPLACRSDGAGKGNRTAAWCTLRGADLTERMIRDGYGLRWNYQ